MALLSMFLGCFEGCCYCTVALFGESIEVEVVPTVYGRHLEEPKMGPNMSEVEFHCFCCCSSLRAWDEKCHFSEATYHYLPRMRRKWKLLIQPMLPVGWIGL
jgi:hypothetical protein